MDTIQTNYKDSVINTELSKVNNWLVSNKLSLNINKTKNMLFHKAPKHVPHLHLHINNNEISHVKTCTFFGLQMNDNLKWNTHIDHVLKKCLDNRLAQLNETDITTINFTLHL